MTAENSIPQKSSNELALDRTHMAVSRTVAAYDRTLMAWVRTCVSLISFGFTIYKFFQTFAEKGVEHALGFFGPRQMGILMISIGLTTLLMATVQNYIELKKLKKANPDFRIPFSISKILAILIILLAMFLLFLALIKE